MWGAFGPCAWDRLVSSTQEWWASSDHPHVRASAAALTVTPFPFRTPLVHEKKCSTCCAIPVFKPQGQTIKLDGNDILKNNQWLTLEPQLWSRSPHRDRCFRLSVKVYFQQIKHSATHCQAPEPSDFLHRWVNLMKPGGQIRLLFWCVFLLLRRDMNIRPLWELQLYRGLILQP